MKTCPLLTMARIMAGAEPERAYTACNDACAWYYGTECAVNLGVYFLEEISRSCQSQ